MAFPGGGVDAWLIKFADSQQFVRPHGEDAYSVLEIFILFWVNLRIQFGSGSSAEDDRHDLPTDDVMVAISQLYWQDLNDYDDTFDYDADCKSVLFHYYTIILG